MSFSGASERSVPATKIEITTAPPSTHNFNLDSKSDPFSRLSPTTPAPSYTLPEPLFKWLGIRRVEDDTKAFGLNKWKDGVAINRDDFFFRENIKERKNSEKALPLCHTLALLEFRVGRPISTRPLTAWRPKASWGWVGVPGKKCGTILLTAEELSNCRDIATMQLCANKLDKKDFFGKSDPFLVFYRSNEDGTIKSTSPALQVDSSPIEPLGKQRNSLVVQTVKIDVYDWDRDGSHDFIGEFTTSYRELSKAQNQFTVYEVLNPRKKCKKKKYVNSGTVTLLSFSVDSEFTFVDYIKGGTQLNFTVAIDFTASNGNPLQPTSLHYMSPYQLSAYAMALKAVGEIIQDYDSDKLFPAYGFGAKLPPEGRISHQFPLNNNDEDPNCAGIEGVLESYFQSLRTVQLYGPTYFAPVINQVARAAAKISDGSQYYVLLIITDGVISDMTQTKEAIVSASSLPMSIIIVGVGPAMFEAMEELDGDDVRVSSRGRYAERDIVQFVPFRDYVDRSGNQVLSMARLAKDVLAEIPEQLLSYMRTRDIQPRPPPPTTPSPTPAPEHP
ncbi:hypothetical protein FD754_010500 [Muntiacus muntjak]|uniref:Uncharacterized protein n=1 Tax=Muntiacus muntjak TaxID=9888 RepID=A0A5N3WY27_MUNMU|nr:hypothetical protein FD754_010500 [Muntiacus muntjak]